MFYYKLIPYFSFPFNPNYKVDNGSNPQHSLLFDRLVQQIVLQTSQANQNSDAIVSEDNDPISPLNNLNVKEIVHQLDIDNRVFKTSQRESYVTLKDH